MPDLVTELTTLSKIKLQSKSNKCYINIPQAENLNVTCNALWRGGLRLLCNKWKREDG